MTSINHSWSRSDITERLKISTPLIQAPMAGGATTPQLVAAVSNAGGLGSFAAGYLSAEDIRKAIQQIRALTDQAFAVNLFVPEKHHATEEQIERARKAVQISCQELNCKINSIKPPYAPHFEEQLNVILEEHVPIFSFTFGIPSQHWIEKFKHQDVILIGTATTLEEAKYLEERLIDIIVAQGSEAGGHRGTFLGKPEAALAPTSSLIQSFVSSINIPVIAAGGIMNAAGITTSLMLGASGVQMGTAFLCCDESGIHPLYKKTLLNSSQDDTMLTRAFSGKLARGINNEFMLRMQWHENDILDYPIQNTLTKPMRKEAEKQNNPDFMSLFAGQAAFLCQAMPATKLIQELNQDVITLLNSQ